MTEAGERAECVYFGPPQEQLFGWYHAPAKPARAAAVILVAPLGVEAVFAHRAFRHIADRLSSDGFAVLRYDHHGTGDSSGSGTEADQLARWREGVRHAAAVVRARSGAHSLCLFGLRFGGTLAALTATEAGADSLVLWAPVVRGRPYVRELRAFSQMADGGDRGIGGFDIPAQTLDDISKCDITALAAKPARRALFIPRDDLPDTGDLPASLASLGVDVTTSNTPGYSTTVVEPHHTEVPEAIISSVRDWLRALYGVGGSDAPHEIVTSPSMSLRSDGADLTERGVFLTSDRRLFGILASPAGPAKDTTIILVNAGAVYHVGPHRLYVALARDWAAAGFPVLRMDIGGLGESRPAEGLAENDTYPVTAVDDVERAINWLRSNGASRFVIAGLCSGAHATFHVGLEKTALQGLRGLMMLNPIVFYWKKGDAIDVSAWQNYAATRWYRQQAASAATWIRLLKGQINVIEVGGTYLVRMRTLFTAAIGRLLSRMNPFAPHNLARDLRSLTSRPIDVLLAFSEGDPGTDQLKLHAGHALRSLSAGPNFHLVHFAGADHTFTQLDAQRRVREFLVKHLAERFA